jgi:hypothetical protein
MNFNERKNTQHRERSENLFYSVEYYKVSIDN